MNDGILIAMVAILLALTGLLMQVLSQWQS
jgi:hypothetical protein